MYNSDHRSYTCNTVIVFFSSQPFILWKVNALNKYNITLTSIKPRVKVKFYCPSHIKI